MRSGSLRHHLKIYRLSTTPDAYGAMDTSYSLWKTVPSAVRFRTFRERAENGETLSTVQYEITVRYDEDLEVSLPTSEVEVMGRRLKVMAIGDPRGQRKSLMIYAEERR